MKTEEKMSLYEILNHRRAIRHYDSTKTLDTEKVKECIKWQHWLQRVQICSFGRLTI